jgi:hypothetical protein
MTLVLSSLVGKDSSPCLKKTKGIPGGWYLVDKVKDGIDQDIECRSPGDKESPPPPAVILRRKQRKGYHSF